MSDTPTSRKAGPRWYRSLYWRIGIGLFAFLALMLAAQGALFLWITDRIAGSMPANSPQRLAELVSSDISTALADDPALVDRDETIQAAFEHQFVPLLGPLERRSKGAHRGNRRANASATTG